jgi:iron complex transport system permease protein
VTLVERIRVRRPIPAGALLVVLVVALLLLALLALTVASPLGPLDVLRTLVGGGDRGEQFIVWRLRAPRLVVAVLVGAALGLAGALLQSVVRNPLASPDIIGISGGASAAAVAAVLLGGLSGPAVAASAAGGATAAALLVGVLAWRRGLGGDRFVLIGVGMAFVGSSLVGYLLTRADVAEAQTALVWLVGSIGSATWADAALLAVVLLLATPLLLVVRRPMDPLALGDDAATALGVRPVLVRGGAIALCVALAATATSVAGPVAFVAFVSAPIARRMLGREVPALLPAALTGATLVAGADLLAQHALPEQLQVPVGIITAVLGAPYLLWLLTRSRRSA